MMNDGLFDNRGRIKELIMSLSYDNQSKYNLIDFLEKETNYFSSPLSLKGKFSCSGGLMDYVLSTYDTLKQLVTIKGYNYSNDDLVVTSLFHILYKVNMYIVASKNVKEYHDAGVKFDELGHFDWKTKLVFEYSGDTNLVYGDYGIKSYMLISRYLPLSDEEIMAIMYYNAWDNLDKLTDSMYNTFEKYPLISLLHCASILTLGA